MTRARDVADAGKVINYLDDIASDVQTQLTAASASGGGYDSSTISTNTTLDADTEYTVGKSLIINNGITLTIPVDTMLEQKVKSAGKAL